MVQNDYRFDLFKDVMLSPVFIERNGDSKTKSKDRIFLNLGTLRKQLGH